MFIGHVEVSHVDVRRGMCKMRVEKKEGQVEKL